MRTPNTELYRFRMLTEVRCGAGITDSLVDQLIGIPITRSVVVVDRNVRNTQQVKHVIRQLKRRTDLLCVDGPDGEPDFEYLENLKSQALSHKTESVLGVGGGSTLDSAKGLAIVLTNDGSCEQYQGLEKYKSPGLPCVTIPSLFGSGAEVTPSAVFINRSKNQKGGINGPAVFPKLALVDPKMMAGAPLPVIGSTAMDAMVHAIESYTARCATPVSKMFSLHALQTLLEAMDLLKVESRSLDGLLLLARGTFFAITSLMHSEQGLAGGSSYPMGVFYNIPHGVGGGRCLPHAIMHNDLRSKGLWDELATSALGWSRDDVIGSAQTLAGKLLDYMEFFQVPLLDNWLNGVDIPFLAGEIYNFRGVMEQNPVDLMVDDIQEFLEKMLQEEKSLDQYHK